MKKALSFLLLLFLYACGSSSSPPVATPNPNPPPPPPPPSMALQDFTQSIQGLALDDFFEVSFKGLIGRSPESVVALTLENEIPQPVPILNSIAQDYADETFDMYQVALDTLLSAYDRASLAPDEQINFDVYEWYLRDVVDSRPYQLNEFVGTYMGFSVHRSTERFFVDLHPLQTVEDAHEYVARLQLVDEKFAELELLLRRMRSTGIIEPQLTTNVAINVIGPLTDALPENHPFLARLIEALDDIPNLDAATRTNIETDAQAAIADSVIPAYRSLRTVLQGLSAVAPTAIGVGQYFNGAAYYDYALRHHTTSDLTAAEIHQLGLDELDRIHAEMRTLFDQLGYPQNETLEELYGRVASDGGIVLAADSFQTFTDLVAFAEANLSQAFDVFPQADVVVEPDPFGGFYIGPSFDGTRPGAFFAGTDFDQPYFAMPSLTFHESVPGHHLQIAIAMESDLPTFRKIVRSTGFVEGWALYAERLASELGWYDNDVFGELGRLQYEALRAARLVMDTGIHSLNWTFNQAAEFNQANVGASLGASQGAAGRYSVWPGQATAYMVGMLQILSERQRAMDALGAQFDLIAFHRALLTNGGVPLSLLPTIVDQYIASAQP